MMEHPRRKPPLISVVVNAILLLYLLKRYRKETAKERVLTTRPRLKNRPVCFISLPEFNTDHDLIIFINILKI
jgi:hypothetical protein